jgi:hypothetical protein
MAEKTDKIIKKLDVTLFGEKFTLPVRYDVFCGEMVLDSQKYALEMFLGKADELLADTAEVKNYIENKKQTKVHDILEELVPECIYVERNDIDRYVAVFLSGIDENGKRTRDSLAIEFRNEEFYRVGDRSVAI